MSFGGTTTTTSRLRSSLRRRWLTARSSRPTFANKMIVYGPKSGPTPASCYDIQQVCENYTGPNGVLGAATDAETPLPDGVGRKRDYAGGSIYWTAPLCAHEVNGAIAGEYGATGNSQGFLGYPVTNEMTTPMAWATTITFNSDRSTGRQPPEPSRCAGPFATNGPRLVGSGALLDIPCPMRRMRSTAPEGSTFSSTARFIGRVAAEQ
jgi:hypothetical protein